LKLFPPQNIFSEPQELKLPAVSGVPGAQLQGIQTAIAGGSSVQLNGIASAPASSVIVSPAATQEELAQRFALESGLKLDWAVKCLEENQWNYNIAAGAFTEYKNKGSIPPQAFANP
jgi:hypothetical protein